MIVNAQIYYPSTVTPLTGVLVPQTTTAYDLRTIYNWTDSESIASTTMVKVNFDARGEVRLYWPKEEFEAAKVVSLDAAQVWTEATAPANTVAPLVSGAAPEGSTLSTTNGTWTGTPVISYTYQWTRDGVDIVGATDQTYDTVVADIGTDVGCTVTAHNIAGDTAEPSSNDIAVGTLPVNTVAPLVSGLAPQGSTLSSTTGTWTGSPTITYTYQWTRDGADIVGETNPTYLSDVLDVGTDIGCTVTAHNPVGDVAEDSSNTITVTA